MVRTAPHYADKEGNSPSGSREFLIVGVGVSPSDEGAFQELLRAFPQPASSSCAFVLVPHPASSFVALSSDRLPTAMPVLHVTEKTEVSPGRVYVLPPNTPISFRDGFLCPDPQTPESFMPVDHFFRSLAAERPNAVGVMLAGGSWDGVEGLKAIKGEGGITFLEE